MAYVGYVRVSTIDQSTERQLEGIALDKVFEEKVSARTADRPKLNELLDYVREGDEVIVHDISRLARNMEDLHRLVRQITDKGCTLRFVKENLTFTNDQTDAVSQLLLSMLGAVYQFERNIMLERQREGIAIAKAKGRYKGRPKTIDRSEILTLLDDGLSMRKTAGKLGVSLSTVQRVKMENELDSMRRALRAHACHSCNDRETHARFAERADRLNRESDGLRSRVENRTHVIAKTFDRICNVLTHLGYIEGEKPLEQGKILAKIYAESDLLLTESIRRGVFDNLSSTELLSVASAMIYESRSIENYAPKMPHQNVTNALSEIIRIWAKLEEVENEFDVKTQKEPDFGFAYISYRWAQGNSLSNVLKGSDMSVGDFVRSTKQLMDLLMQIAGASEQLRPVCREAIKRLDRGVVSYMVDDL